jgi:hypothetical protein
MVTLAMYVPGDSDKTGAVAVPDNNVWRNTVGLTGDRRANVNNNSVVGQDDDYLWKNNFDSMGAGATIRFSVLRL